MDIHISRGARTIPVTMSVIAVVKQFRRTCRSCGCYHYGCSAVNASDYRGSHVDVERVGSDCIAVGIHLIINGQGYHTVSAAP